ncbi:MAG: AAA family ATPase [Proteobacteria bacterium]|nr:AAA family ATPase [Pseudomonadota bacterium]
MRIVKLSVQNFRSISELEWTLEWHPLCCLIGPGDSGKSTVLDAIEAVLSSRWYTFGEADFRGCDTSRSIKIEVTIAELSKPLLSDEKFGLYIRGLAPDGTVRDEPEDGDEPVLTVRLSVDATMEPLWEVVNDRTPYPRTMSNRDRALFRVVRLTGDDARHLTWGQGSILSKLTESGDEAAQQLAEAYRAAKASTQLHEIESLAKVAREAQERAVEVGAIVEDEYIPGLELLKGGFSSGSIALHDGAVPLRLAGTGTRRLATLAIQRAAIEEGAIILVDEIEQGLEPHRILGAIVHLRQSQAATAAVSKPTGQIVMTTHSDTALSEIPPEGLYVCRRASGNILRILHPTDQDALRRVLKHMPRALFARRLLVCEGDTELGLILGLRELFPSRHGGASIEQRGAAVVDGEGTNAPQMAAALAALGYTTALYRDSDIPVPTKQQEKLDKAGVHTITYPTDMAIEEALFAGVADDELVDELLMEAERYKGEATVIDQLNKAFPEADTSGIGNASFVGMDSTLGLERGEIMKRLGYLAKQYAWFKNQYIARGLAPVVDQAIAQSPTSEFALALREIEAWLYA